MQIIKFTLDIVLGSCSLRKHRKICSV